MYESFEKYLGLNMRMFILMGLSITFDTTENKKKYVFLQRLPSLTASTIGIIETGFYIRSIINHWSDDLSFTIQLASNLFGSAIALCKGLRLASVSDQIQTLLIEVAKMWEKYPPHSQLQKKVLKAAERALFISKLYFYHIYLNVVVAIPPYIYIFQNCLTSDSVNRTCNFSEHVYIIEYPYDINTRFLYILHIIKEQMVFFNITVFWACCDTIFIQIVTHVTLQLKILKFDIKDISERENDEKRLKIHLIHFIKRHQNILRVCYQIEKIYSPVLFVVVLMSSMTVCVAIFGLKAIVQSSNYEDIVVFIVIFIGVVYQVLVYCIYADSITQEILSMANTIYNSNWTGKNYKLRIYFQILIMRSQNPFYFSALKLFNVNLERLMIITKGAASYYMMLRTVSDV